MRASRNWLLVACCLALTSAARVEAQDTDNRSSPIFLTRQYVFARLPANDLLFEALLAPHLFIHEGRYQDGGRVFLGPVWAWKYGITPMVSLRMLSTTSLPVRTPSYMPRPFTFQFLRASLIAPDDQLASPIRVWGLTLLPWAHHSNGQDGCLYQDQVRVGEECRDGPQLPGTRRVTNKTDGSFSTNFVQATLGYRKLVLETDDASGLLESTRTCELTLRAEYHPRGYGPGGLSDEQGELYPTFRLQTGMTVGFSNDHSFLRGRSGLGGSVEWLNRPAYDLSHWAFSLEATHVFARTGWGLFARYYRGMDYYNLGFLNTLSTLNFGVVIDAWRPEQFGLPASQPLSKGSYPSNMLLDRVLAWPADGLCAVTQK
jgi:hypothetical protein